MLTNLQKLQQETAEVEKTDRFMLRRSEWLDEVKTHLAELETKEAQLSRKEEQLVQWERRLNNRERKIDNIFSDDDDVDDWFQNIRKR